jgi:hypothetical protein
MKKIVTILTAASLFAVVSASAQIAQAAPLRSTNVTFSGTVPVNCQIDGVTNGTLIPSGTRQLVTDTPGVVTVTCNTTRSQIDVATNIGAGNAYNGTGSALIASGTGAYSGAVAGSSSVTASGLASASTVSINAGISAPDPLAAATNYSVVAVVTLTP